MMTNGFTVLGATVLALTLVAGCGSPTTKDGSVDPAGEESALTAAPDFRAPGVGAALKIDGRDAKFAPVNAAVTKLAKDMTDANNIQNNSFYAAVYVSAPGNLGDFDSTLNSYAVRNNMAFDIMFRSDGSKPGDAGGFGWQQKWNPENETMGCLATDRAKADSRFKRFSAYVSSHGDSQIPVAKRSVIETSATVLVRSFVKSAPASAKLYKCHWDNTDDTSADALLLVDAKTGEIRVIVALQGA